MALRKLVPMDHDLEARRCAEAERIAHQYPRQPMLPILGGVLLTVVRNDAKGTLHLHVDGRMYPLADEATVVADLQLHGKTVFGS